MQKLKDIPRKVRTWAFIQMPCVKSFMVYTRKNRNVEAFCTTCGKTTKGITEIVTMEDHARTVMRPEHRAESRCPACGAIGEWRAYGRCRGVYGHTFYYIFGQKIGEDFVFRACSCSLTLYRDKQCEIFDHEYARVFLSKGKKAKKSWTITYGYGKDSHEEWVDYYPGYYGSCSIKRDHIYPGTYTAIGMTPMLKYGKHTRYDIIDYYSAFSRYPDMELAQKLGMDDLVRALVYQHGANLNPRAKTIWDRLRINKDRLKDLQIQKGNIQYLHAYQQERREKTRFSDRKIEEDIYIQNLWSKREREIMREVLQHTSLERIRKYKAKQEAKQKRSGGYWNVSSTYTDYLGMRIGQGYDLSNEIILFPKDLKRRHDEMVEEARTKEAEEKRAKMEEKYPKISKDFERLNKKFGFSDKDFIIRPVKCAAEIADEGRELHHCVGSGDLYYSKHSRGESYILVLRKADDPVTPFATIEISGSRIIQWYEAYDEKPDEEVIQPWLDKYTEHLREKAGQKGGKKKAKTA